MLDMHLLSFYSLLVDVHGKVMLQVSLSQLAHCPKLLACA